MKVTYYLSSSLDGYIAKKDGDVSWLDNLGISMEDAGYDEFYETVDAVIMGRKTYEFIVEFGTWPYDDKPAWICSSTPVDVMTGCNLQEDLPPSEAVYQAKEMGCKHLWIVGGGLLAASLVNDALVTDISVSMMPVILGGDVRLFSGVRSDVALKMTDDSSMIQGFAQLNYKVKGVDAI